MTTHSDIMHNALSERKRLLHYPTRYASDMTTPNQRLKQARIAAGFASAVDAADALSIPRSTYIGHENGHRGFPAARVPQYAKKFKVSEEWLLYGKGAKAPEPSEALISLVVTLPNEKVLTEMFAGLLELIGVDPDADARAQTLARHFPSAFALAAAQNASPDHLIGNLRGRGRPAGNATPSTR
jgi:hypothetical protein